MKTFQHLGIHITYAGEGSPNQAQCSAGGSDQSIQPSRPVNVASIPQALTQAEIASLAARTPILREPTSELYRTGSITTGNLMCQQSSMQRSPTQHHFGQPSFAVHSSVLPSESSVTMMPPSSRTSLLSSSPSNPIIRVQHLPSSSPLFTPQLPIALPPPGLVSDDSCETIPPRRELPFKRPFSPSRPTSAASVHRSGSIPPLFAMPSKMPVDARDPAKKRARRAGQQVKTNSSFYRADDVTSPKGRHKLPPPRQIEEQIPKTMETEPANPVSPSSVTKATTSSVSRPANTHFPPSTIRATPPSPLGRLPINAGAVSTSSSQDADYDLEILDEHGSYLIRPEAQPRTVDNDGTLAQYAASSRNERMGMLDDFFVNNLENEGFVTLCEDVEALSLIHI